MLRESKLVLTQTDVLTQMASDFDARLHVNLNKSGDKCIYFISGVVIMSNDSNNCVNSYPI